MGLQPVAQLQHILLGILRPTISADCSNHRRALHRGTPAMDMRLRPRQLHSQRHQPHMLDPAKPCSRHRLRVSTRRFSLLSKTVLMPCSQGRATLQMRGQKRGGMPGIDVRLRPSQLHSQSHQPHMLDPSKPRSRHRLRVSIRRFSLLLETALVQCSQGRGTLQMRGQKRGGMSQTVPRLTGGQSSDQELK